MEVFARNNQRSDKKYFKAGQIYSAWISSLQFGLRWGKKTHLVVPFRKEHHWFTSNPVWSEETIKKQRRKGHKYCRVRSRPNSETYPLKNVRIGPYMVTLEQPKNEAGHEGQHPEIPGENKKGPHLPREIWWMEEIRTRALILFSLYFLFFYFLSYNLSVSTQIISFIIFLEIISSRRDGCGIPRLISRYCKYWNGLAWIFLLSSSYFLLKARGCFVPDNCVPTNGWLQEYGSGFPEVLQKILSFTVFFFCFILWFGGLIFGVNLASIIFLLHFLGSLSYISKTKYWPSSEIQLIVSFSANASLWLTY